MGRHPYASHHQRGLFQVLIIQLLDGPPIEFDSDAFKSERTVMKDPDTLRDRWSRRLTLLFCFVLVNFFCARLISPYVSLVLVLLGGKEPDYQPDLDNHNYDKILPIGEHGAQKVLNDTLSLPRQASKDVAINESSPLSLQSLALKASWESVKTRSLLLNGTMFQQTISFAVVPLGNKPALADDVTLLTHLSANKLDTLVRQVARWQGPVSAAILISSDQDLEDFVTFVAQHHDGVFRRTSFHIFMETPRSPRGYPHNILRNLALKYMQTDYFLALDSDFVTTKRCYDRLVGYLAMDDFKTKLQAKTLLVLPAFEVAPEANASIVPESRSQVVQLLQQKTVAQFEMDLYARGHLATNFPKWLAASKSNLNPTGSIDDITYPIRYLPQFEPYVMGYRYGVPPYWKGFRGYYFDKASWFAEMYFMGYQYMVAYQDFVFHVGKSTLPPKDKKFRKNFNVWDEFKAYLSRMYNAPLSERGWKKWAREKRV